MATNKQDALIELAQRINELAESRYQSVINGEDDSYKEFVESLGYGESDVIELVRESRLDDDIKEVILSQGSTDAALKFVEPYLYVDVVDIWRRDEEIFSLTVGELEEQLPDDIAEEWGALSQEEREFVAKRLDYYMSADKASSFVYIDLNYCRYILCIDQAALALDLPDDDGPDGGMKSSTISSLNQIKQLSAELDRLKAATSPKHKSKTRLQCAGGQGFEAVDLMNWRINKRLISKRSSAKLKSVG